MNYTHITENLLIGTTPGRKDYDELRRLGVKLVINMRVERRPYPDAHPSPVRVLWLPSFDSPAIPIPVRFLVRGAKAALDVIKQGGRVYTHCAQGVHRGVAMGAAILIAQGYTPEEAIELIRSKRNVADPGIWYIRRQIFKFAQEWQRLNPDRHDAPAPST